MLGQTSGCRDAFWVRIIHAGAQPYHGGSCQSGNMHLLLRVYSCRRACIHVWICSVYLLTDTSVYIYILYICVYILYIHYIQIYNILYIYIYIILYKYIIYIIHIYIYILHMYILFMYLIYCGNHEYKSTML
jgi:hypothetical protein